MQYLGNMNTSTNVMNTKYFKTLKIFCQIDTRKIFLLNSSPVPHFSLPSELRTTNLEIWCCVSSKLSSLLISFACVSSVLLSIKLGPTDVSSVIIWLLTGFELDKHLVESFNCLQVPGCWLWASHEPNPIFPVPNIQRRCDICMIIIWPEYNGPAAQ